LPSGTVEVHRDELAAIAVDERIEAGDDLSVEVLVEHVIGHRHELLARTLVALHLWS
jgi:hypothetical protein